MVKVVLDISIGTNIAQISVPLIMQYCNHFSCPPLLEVLGGACNSLYATARDSFPLGMGMSSWILQYVLWILSNGMSKGLMGSSIRYIQPCALGFPPQSASGSTSRIVDYLHEGRLQKLIFSLATNLVLWKNLLFLEILHMSVNSLQHHCFFKLITLPKDLCIKTYLSSQHLEFRW